MRGLAMGRQIAFWSQYSIEPRIGELPVWVTVCTSGIHHFVQAMTNEELEETRKLQEWASEIFKQQDKQQEEFNKSSDRWDSAIKEVVELKRQVSSVLKSIAVLKKDIDKVEFINKADFVNKADFEKI